MTRVSGAQLCFHHHGYYCPKCCHKFKYKYEFFLNGRNVGSNKTIYNKTIGSGGPSFSTSGGVHLSTIGIVVEFFQESQKNYQMV